MTSQLLSTADAARRLGVTTSTVNRLVARGDMTPAHQLPGRTGARLFTAAEVERVRHQRQQHATGPKK